MKNKISIFKGIALFAIATTATLLTSCTKQKEKEMEASTVISPDLKMEKSMESSAEYQLLGRKGKIVFPDRTAEVEYVNERQLHWKTTTANNEVVEGSESINYAQISEHQYFLNWIEDTGFTVSQIIDTKTGEVKAFWSFNDPKSTRGGRSSSFIQGKFEFRR